MQYINRFQKGKSIFKYKRKIIRNAKYIVTTWNTKEKMSVLQRMFFFPHFNYKHNYRKWEPRSKKHNVLPGLRVKAAGVMISLSIHTEKKLQQLKLPGVLL